MPPSRVPQTGVELVFPAGRRSLSGRRGHPEQIGEAFGVPRRLDLDVVVEVDVHVPPSAVVPGPDLAGPGPQGPVGVAADVEFFVAVQPDVGEVGGLVFEEGPLPGGIGDDEGDAVFFQQPFRGRLGEAGVPDFEGVPEGRLGSLSR